MAYSGVIEDFQRIRENKTPRRVPIVTASEEFDVKWHGKYNYEEFCQDGEKMYEVVKAAIDHFNYDWAWLQIDDCFEFEPVGVAVKGEGNILRATYGYLPADRETLKNLPILDPLKDGRMPEKLKAIRKLKDHYKDTVLVTGSCAAPFSAVGLTFSIGESMMLMYTDPDFLHDAMEYWKEFYKRYIKAQKMAGADAIWLGDCNAYSSMVSVPQYEKFILPVTKELVGYCEKELDIMIWMHNSETKLENVISHMPVGMSFESIGPDGDIGQIRQATKGKQPISGNLDPLKVLWQGNPDSITAEVNRMMSICKDGGGFICNTGEMNPRDTPVENMEAYMAAALSVSEY